MAYSQKRAIVVQDCHVNKIVRKWGYCSEHKDWNAQYNSYIWEIFNVIKMFKFFKEESWKLRLNTHNDFNQQV